MWMESSGVQDGLRVKRVGADVVQQAWKSHGSRTEEVGAIVKGGVHPTPCVCGRAPHHAESVCVGGGRDLQRLADGLKREWTVEQAAPAIGVAVVGLAGGLA